MKVVSKEEFLSKKKFYFAEMRKGKIFIYPTDTIYGIGCDATQKDSVLKIRKAKQREEKPFSVIAPSKEWISQHCVVDSKVRGWVKKLPGAYTLILLMPGKNVLAKEVNASASTLGVRIPDHWFSDIVSEFGKPFVTTSVNLTGQAPLYDISELSKDIERFVDYFVYEGKKEGRASTIVDLSGSEEKVVKR